MALLPRAAAAFSPTSIFSTQSTPARQVNELSFFVMGISAAIFLAVGLLLVYALIKFRARSTDTAEPPQVFGSTQIELSWTIIPILIVTVLFLGTARVLFSVQDTPRPASALDVTAVGHQYWWEFSLPAYNITAANELHIPLGRRYGAGNFSQADFCDVIHSFWIPQLGGKTDMLPNRVNEMWFDPKTPGVYLGQCAQFCGAQHAKMLLTVYVDTPEQFASWIAAQQKPWRGCEQRRGGGKCRGRRRDGCGNGPEGLRAAGLRQLPHCFRHDGKRTFRAGPDAPDEPQVSGLRRDGEYAGEPEGVDCGPKPVQAGLPDAGHAPDRPAERADNNVPADAEVRG